MPRDPLTRVWQWVANQFVQDVPTESALCEYDCRKGQCCSGEWEVCERRLHKAAGELMPVHQDPGREPAQTGPSSTEIDTQENPQEDSKMAGKG